MSLHTEVLFCIRINQVMLQILVLNCVFLTEKQEIISILCSLLFGSTGIHLVFLSFNIWVLGMGLSHTSQHANAFSPASYESELPFENKVSEYSNTAGTQTYKIYLPYPVYQNDINPKDRGRGGQNQQLHVHKRKKEKSCWLSRRDIIHSIK